MTMKFLVTIGIIIIGIIGYLSVIGSNQADVTNVQIPEEVTTSTITAEDGNDEEVKEMEDDMYMTGTSTATSSIDTIEFLSTSSDSVSGSEVSPNIRNQYGTTDVFMGDDLDIEELRTYCESQQGVFNECGPSQCSESEEGEPAMCTRDCALTCTY